MNLYALDTKDGLRDKYRRGLRFGPPEVRWLQSYGALPASVIRPNHHRGCASYLLPEQWRGAFSAKLELVDDFPPFCKHEASKELVLSSLLEAKEVATESHSPGVYFLFDEGALVYVGQSVAPLYRISQHSRDPNKKFDAAAVLPCPKEDLDCIERALIRFYRPRHNGMSCLSARSEVLSEDKETLLRLGLAGQ